MNIPNIQNPPTASAAHSGGVTVLSGRQSTQGIKLGHMRYVLGIGLALAVGAGVLLAIFH